MVRTGVKNGLQGFYGIRLKTEKVLAFSVIGTIIGSSLKQENSYGKAQH